MEMALWDLGLWGERLVLEKSGVRIAGNRLFIQWIVVAMATGLSPAQAAKGNRERT